MAYRNESALAKVKELGDVGKSEILFRAVAMSQLRKMAVRRLTSAFYEHPQRKGVWIFWSWLQGRQGGTQAQAHHQKFSSNGNLL